jgi:predicted regulator of Ras-like GTPase activity (Roadblock/LC7/MglB family)
MKDMILFPEDIDRLNGILLPLTQKANLLLAVLINKDGRLLTNQGILESVDIVSLGALVAGNSASTLAIAHLVGETEFCAMYHQGKDKHIYISSVDDETFLALIFDDRTNIDRVKVFVRQFERDMKEALVQVYSKSEDQVDLDMDVGSVLFGNVAAAMQQTAAPKAPPPYPKQPQGDVVYMDMNAKPQAQYPPPPPQQYR